MSVSSLCYVREDLVKLVTSIDRYVIKRATIPYTCWSPKWLSVSTSFGSKMKILPLEIDIDTSAFSQTTVSFILMSAVPFTDELLSSVNVIDFSLLYGLKSVI